MHHHDSNWYPAHTITCAGHYVTNKSTHFIPLLPRGGLNHSLGGGAFIERAIPGVFRGVCGGKNDTLLPSQWVNLEFVRVGNKGSQWGRDWKKAANLKPSNFPSFPSHSKKNTLPGSGKKLQAGSRFAAGLYPFPIGGRMPVAFTGETLLRRHSCRACARPWLRCHPPRRRGPPRSGLFSKKIHNVGYKCPIYTQTNGSMDWSRGCLSRRVAYKWKSGTRIAYVALFFNLCGKTQGLLINGWRQKNLKMLLKIGRLSIIAGLVLSGGGDSIWPENPPTSPKTSRSRSRVGKPAQWICLKAGCELNLPTLFGRTFGSTFGTALATAPRWSGSAASTAWSASPGTPKSHGR